MRIHVLMILLVGFAGIAEAQFRLPTRLPTRVPDLLPDTPLDPTESLIDQLEDRVLDEIEDARNDALNTLVRANGDLLERGPGGSVVLRGEVLVVDPDIVLLTLAQQSGFRIIEDRTEPALGLRYVRLRAPNGTRVQLALQILRGLDPDGLFDYNTIYMPSGMATAYQGGFAAQIHRNLTVGIIDAGVPARSPVFAAGQVEARHFRGTSVVPHDHGLQVAAILGSGNGVIPGAQILAADVYGGQPTGGSADTLIRALGWMAEADVRVVNISIVGPENLALRAAVRRFTAQGRLIVAAVGNDGANARPLYPAAYDDVVAVTGVNADDEILPEAVQGDHVDFAARGMDMVWPSLNNDYVQVRGTSFASPIVAGLLAHQTMLSGSTEAALSALTARAEDLGRRGHDRVYGHGLVGDSVFQPASARLAGN
ncbi:MAG: hypothetical protein DHS20C06_00310 [Hyphobacterium sp.]|nr:MAG: hypothetical protein DHS20C06_00310 [Hyphobacterium sp.]